MSTTLLAAWLYVAAGVLLVGGCFAFLIWDVLKYRGKWVRWHWRVGRRIDWR
jgi:hypothetical protein